jgi:hypothetical protein
MKATDGGDRDQTLTGNTDAATCAEREPNRQDKQSSRVGSSFGGEGLRNASDRIDLCRHLKYALDVLFDWLAPHLPPAPFGQK